MGTEKTIRLGQLCRLLNMAMPTIINLIKDKGYELENNPNAKINESLLKSIAEDFENEDFLYPIVNLRINECRKFKEKKINLSRYRLKSIPIAISELIWLKELDLSQNQISKINSLDRLITLKSLDLSQNKITHICGLDKLTSLENLDISSNQISKIEGLNGLVKLSKLVLLRNPIPKIEGLDALIKLSELYLSFSLISKIEGLNKLTNLSTLYLQGTQISKIENLEFLENLRMLDMHKNKITKIENIELLNNLLYLNLSQNQISKIEGLDTLQNLAELTLNGNQIREIEGLNTLKNLSELNLGGNQIAKINGLIDVLPNLSVLSLSGNNITKIEGLNTLQNLSELGLNNNQILKIEGLDLLENLKKLGLNNNKIQKIEGLNSLINLSWLQIDCNPFYNEFNLERFHNHWPIIKNIMDREAEKNKIAITLPAKILLLGNHAAGKSSLLHYLQNQDLDYIGNSTHILNVESFPKNNKNIDAIFYDFGGQDYYHGIYRAFLSAGAGYLLLWDTANNENKEKNSTDGLPNQNFALPYWLGQKAYLEKEKYQSEFTDPVLLIQTHAEDGGRPAFVDLSRYEDVTNTFYVSLHKDYNPPKNQQALIYLQSEIEGLIEDKKVIREEPRWYVQFVEWVFEQQKADGAYETTDIKTLTYTPKAHKDNEENRLESLRAELEQFHSQGLVLYYPNINPDLVWLNPKALVKYVHDTILNKAILSKSKGRVPLNTFAKYDPNIIKLLQEQKVLFRHKYGENNKPEYIIPNFLPLVEADKTEYDLFTFGLIKPSFVLKFEHFLPIGLINQMICWFGKQPDNKKFWRNQLLFTLEQKSKVLIRLDFETLEIKVHISCLNQHAKEEKDIKAYLFYCIMALYWDMEPLEYEKFIEKDTHPENDRDFKYENRTRIYERDECRPQDLWVSIDDVYFVNYADLCEQDEKEPRMVAHKIDENRNISKQSKEVAVYPFQLFTNKQFTKMKKIFISYSKDDLAMVNKFIEHLSALQLDGKVAHWYCTELIAGGDWNDDIQSHFDQSDIICFMVSPNLMKTKYIHECEIKKAFERKAIDTDFRIVPIILDFCHWTTEENNLGQFTALPYTAKPVADFKNQNMAWYIIEACLRLMIEQNLNPTGENFYSSQPLPKDILKIYERIVAGKVDENG